MLHPDLVAYLPCPIKVPFEMAIREYLAEQSEDKITLQVEGNANKNEDDYAQFVSATTAEQLPPLLITPGVNQLYRQTFVRQVLDAGEYSDAATYPRSPDRPETELRDPLAHATVLAANVTLIVVDHTQLGKRAVPKTWRDLLAPEFAQSVMMRGNGKTYCETTLLAWQRLFGNEGLVAMGRSVREGKHPAQMAKLAGTGQPGGAAVYVMPYFFARHIQNQDRVQLVWPDEGVIASPVTLLAKSKLTPALHRLAAWLAGPTIARLFSLAGLPTPHPDVQSGMPEWVRYLWSGWASARAQDLSAELSAAEAAFASGHR